MIPALAIALTLMLTPVTCSAISGPHSVYAMPPGMRHHITSTQAAPHAHHHAPVLPVSRMRSTSDHAVSPVSAVSFVASGLVAVLVVPAPDGIVTAVPALLHDLSLTLSGRLLTVEPPPPRF